jgi:hypothetical protein
MDRLVAIEKNPPGEVPESPIERLGADAQAHTIRENRLPVKKRLSIGRETGRSLRRASMKVRGRFDAPEANSSSYFAMRTGNPGISAPRPTLTIVSILSGTAGARVAIEITRVAFADSPA